MSKRFIVNMIFFVRFYNNREYGFYVVVVCEFGCDPLCEDGCVVVAVADVLLLFC